jgi:hypothetical protein
MLEGINWLGVIIATVAAFALGALWYGPLFGKAWMAGLGRTEADFAGGPPMGAILGIQLVATLITAVVLAIIVKAFGGGVLAGLVVGVLCATGFVATAKLSDVIFSRRASASVFWIETANQVVSYALMGGIYGFFG